jgi:predicted transcriptional regulator
MVTKASSPAPTDAEIEILHVLWERGASTVREVHDVVSGAKPVGYTTILKQMQVMHRKGLLVRSDRYRSHLYEPAQTQARTQRQLAASILQQVFGGSARHLLQSALAGRKVDAKELDGIRELLDEYERKTR